MQKLGVKNGAIFVAFCIVFCLFAALYLPYFAPLKPVASASYDFGYNNRVGVVLLLLLVAAAAVFFKGTRLKFGSEVDGEKIGRGDLLLALGLVAAACAAMYAIAGWRGGFLESGYDVDRVWLMLHGRVPYLDFEWPFGKWLLDAPVWLCQTFHISPVAACGVVWAACELYGTVLLRDIANATNIPSRHRRAIFWLLLLAALPSVVSMGIHSSLLRYTLPITMLLNVYRMVESRKRSAAISAFGNVIFLLFISPEMAIAFAFATLVMMLLKCDWRSWENLLQALLTATCFVVSFAFAAKHHVLDTLLASNGGADSFPIAPSPYVLLLIGALFLCACFVYRCVAEKQMQNNSVALIAFSLPMLAAALGRCDLFHVFFNGLALFVVALFCVAENEKVWVWCRAAFVLVFIVVMPIRIYGMTVLSAGVIAVQHGAGSPWAVVEKDADPARLFPAWSEILLHRNFAAPFGYRPNKVGSALVADVDYGFYEGLENANSPAAVQRKIAELYVAPQRALLLPEHFDGLCAVDEGALRKMLGTYYGFPYTAKLAHRSDPHQALCDAIHADFRQVVAAGDATFGYGLWVRK